MLAPQQDEDAEPRANAWPARARQWCRAALALAVVFGSLPLASLLFLGTWGFDGAASIAGLCLLAAGYLYLEGRGRQSPIPDSSTVLAEAIRLAADGETGQAIGLLNEELRLSPRLWQAREYRGHIRLAQTDAEAALHDFTEAIRLAPNEPHLYMLRGHVLKMLGREAEAQADWETASRLGGDKGTAAEG